jgi:hypothetical protein
MSYCLFEKTNALAKRKLKSLNEMEEKSLRVAVSEFASTDAECECAVVLCLWTHNVGRNTPSHSDGQERKNLLELRKK